MNAPQASNPKKILAVQMLMIGLVLLVLGIVVFLLSPLKTMSPFLRKMSLISNVSIILAGLGFAIGGMVRNRRIKKA